MAQLQLSQIALVENTIGIKNYDCLIVAAGSDYRAYEILRKFQKHNVSVKNVFLFDFKERIENLPAEDVDAYNLYKTFGFKINQIPCSIMDPSSCIKSLSKSEFIFSAEDNVAIDISCFTKPYFFSILKYLKEQIRLGTITVFYTEPMAYIFSRELYRSYRSSYGPLSVMEIPGFPGLDTRTKEKVLIVLLGFEGELSAFVSDEVAPNDIIVVNGFPAYSPIFKDISLVNNERLLSSSGASIKYVRANNPFETFNLLELVKKERPDAFLNIAPLGTKPMALGACLFAILYPSVRIVYPLPEKYANKTTRECSCSWSYTIPLNIE